MLPIRAEHRRSCSPILAKVLCKILQKKENEVSFITSESGAVTVDWVVLTAGLVGLGLAVMSVVSSGVEDAATDTQSQLSSPQIFTSFAQREHSALYHAMVARAGLVPDGDYYEDADLRFKEIIDRYSGLTNDDLIAEIQVDEASVPLADRVARLELLESLQASEAGEAEIMSALNIPAVGRGGVQNSIPDPEAYLASAYADQSFSVEMSRARIAIADARGLTY